MLETRFTPSVAIFDGDAPPALAFARSLGAHDVVVDVYSPTRGTVAGVSRYTRYERPCPPLEDADAFIPWLRACLKAGSIEAIAPTSDLLLYYLASVHDDLSPAMQKVLGSADGIFDMIFKDRFHGRCVDVDQPTPRTFTPTSLDAAVALIPELRFPVILKPRSHVGVGGARGVVVHTETDLIAHFVPYPVPSRRVFEKHPDLCWPMIQECVPQALDNLYSVSGIVAPNGQRLSPTRGKPPKWSSGRAISVSACCSRRAPKPRLSKPACRSCVRSSSQASSELCSHLRCEQRYVRGDRYESTRLWADRARHRAGS